MFNAKKIAACAIIFAYAAVLLCIHAKSQLCMRYIDVVFFDFMLHILAEHTQLL